MELSDIEANLRNSDFQYRLKAISALKDYSVEIAVPLLLQHLHDPEFLVRTFVAMGLGKQQTAESFAALLELMKFDNTPSVRAEAANSLSLFGRISAAHLVQACIQDDHWLVRRSIMAALVDLECPDELYDACLQSLSSDDAIVQAAAIDALATLAPTQQAALALTQILHHRHAPSWQVRQHVAYALKSFHHSDAQAALIELRHDPDHRVAAAALETLLP